MSMTWDEFKAKVDAELKAKGKDGSIPIDFIDISAGDSVRAFVTPDGELGVLS